MRSPQFHRFVLLGSAASILLVSGTVASAANKDLVIIHSERWIDTLKGTVKNVSADRAQDIVIIVRFYGDPGTSTPARRPLRTARRQELGQQTARVAALDPGQEAYFEVEIAEKHRKATFYKFDPHAIWPKGSGGPPRRK
ncbi:MAG: hypothetical protein ACREJ6_08125 [Candidatus Methylomirabilis sp.]